jgi:hypothetical protein
VASLAEHERTGAGGRRREKVGERRKRKRGDINFIDSGAKCIC